MGAAPSFQDELKNIERYHIPNARFQDIEPYFNTGDIILFSGKSRWSRIIQTVCRSKWSHIGIVIRTTRFRDKYGENELFLWHSTIDKVVESVLSAEKRREWGFEMAKSGVQLNPLEDALRTYEGMFCVRHLKLPPYLQKHVRSIKNKLFKWMEKEEPKAYENDYLTMLKATIAGQSDIPYEDTSAYFCSELVICTLRQMQIVSVLNSSAYAPHHFSSEMDSINELLYQQWGDKVFYTPEVQIIF